MTASRKISNLFIPKRNLSQEDLEAIDKRIESSKDAKELFDIFIFIKSLNLKFKNQNFLKSYMNVFLLIFLSLWLIMIIAISQTPLSARSFETTNYEVFCALALVTLGWIGIKHSWTVSKQFLGAKQISDSISLKKAVLDNNLEFDKSDKKGLVRFFESQFFIFQQGNCSREIKSYIKGEHENKFFYHYFNLHYVDAHTSTSTDANGNKTSSTTYSHHDLYGIMIPFSRKNFIKISNYELDLKFKKFIKWNTSSLSFNKKFKVYTDNEQAVAVFLQPNVIEQIEEIYQTFPKLDIELSSLGLLTLTTPDKELLNYNRHYGVDQLDLFKEEIKQVLDQTKLHKALRFINFLREYHE